MKPTAGSTLSSHLLREADRFILYPQRVRRTPANLRTQQDVDKVWRKLVEWRKTFAPPSADRLKKFVRQLSAHSRQVLDDYPAILDEFYCRDLLKEVPSIVERTLKLSHVTLSGVFNSEFVYLREAVNCYALGLPRAAVALARAALEDCLRKKLGNQFGKQAVAEQKLNYLIDDLAPRQKLLSREGRTLAHKVQLAANRVLHDQAAALPNPLAVIEDARTVILELSRRPTGVRSSK